MAGNVVSKAYPPGKAGHFEVIRQLPDGKLEKYFVKSESERASLVAKLEAE